jgi:hypothetical protein
MTGKQNSIFFIKDTFLPNLALCALSVYLDALNKTQSVEENKPIDMIETTTTTTNDVSTTDDGKCQEFQSTRLSSHKQT